MTRSREGALVVGAGLMGKWHAARLKRLGVGISGVVDPDHGRATELARVAGPTQTYASVGEALKDRTHLAAHVCTPLASHREVISELLVSGTHVVAEKPLAMTYDATAELVELARSSGLILCPVHQFLFQTGFLRLQRALVSLGPIRHIDMVAASAGAMGGDLHAAEGVVADILPHPLSLMRRLLGPPFGCTEWTVAGGAAGELRASAAFEGATLGILISMSSRPTRNTLRLLCERGTMHLDLYHGFAVREPPTATRARKILRPFTLGCSFLGAASRNLIIRGLTREPAYPGLGALLAGFYSAIAKEGLNPIDDQETLDVARTRDQILSQRR